MKRIIFLIVPVLLVGLFSCKPSVDYSTEIAGIDSLITVVKDVKAKNSKISIERSQAIANEVINNLKAIQTHFVDSIALKEAPFISQYRGLKKLYKNLGQKIMKIENECNNSLIQLNNLKTDLTNQSLEEDKARGYYKKEKLFLKGFISESNTTINGIEIAEVSFDEKNAKILAIIERMKAAKNNN